MKKVLNLKLALLSSLLFSFYACNPENNKSHSSSHNGELSFVFQDVQPEQYGGAWKRVWSLSGVCTDDVAVDEMNNKSGDNWKEVARTNKDGVYVQLDTSKESRLRFDGSLETPWMPILADTLLTDIPASGTEIKGYRCVVPEGSRLILENRNVSFDCHEVIIEGSLLGFASGTSTGRSSGSVQIKADIVKISGTIHLNGEQGVSGRNGEDASSTGPRDEQPSECTNGTAGSQGGSGGNLLIIAKNKFIITSDDQLNVRGGAGGSGGRAGRSSRRRCSAGVSGANGFDGNIQKIIPQL